MKVLSNVFKIHKLFFISVDNYQVILVQNCPLFPAFQPLKSLSRD